MFYDEGHPHERIIIEKGRRILDFLGLPIEGEENVSIAMDSVEIFVYGCVKKALGLQWDQEYIRGKNSEYTLEGHGMTLFDFVDCYKGWRYTQ